MECADFGPLVAGHYEGARKTGQLSIRGVDDYLAEKRVKFRNLEKKIEINFTFLK